MKIQVSLQELKQYADRELAPTAWFEIDQDRIDQFADCTDDHQYVHVDTERMRDSPFERTIAHGFLTLSLLAGHQPTDWPHLQDAEMTLNYGLDRVRFITPVRVNSRVRFHTKILSVREKSPGNVLIKSEKTLEIEGENKPAMIAETLLMTVTKIPKTEP